MFLMVFSTNGEEREDFMNNYYDERCITKANRHFNNISACKILAVDKRGIKCEAPSGKDSVWIRPSDFEITEYEPGMYVDLSLGTVNGKIHSAQLLGFTPKAFISE